MDINKRLFDFMREFKQAKCIVHAYFAPLVTNTFISTGSPVAIENLSLSGKMPAPSASEPSLSTFFLKRSKAPSASASEPPLMNLYAIPWFLTLFSTCLPLETTLRIWDSVLLEGSEMSIRAGLVIVEGLAE